MRKTENRQLLIIKFLNVLEIILICSFNWKPDELTRSVYTWQASGIRYSEILCIPVADHRSNIAGADAPRKTIGFVHPKSGEYMEFSAPLPEYFDNLLKLLKSRS